MPVSAMTVPLWGLVIFILWTIAVVVLLLAVRIRHLSAGGSPKDFGTPDNASLLWRLYRAQANLVENLPLYLGVVFLLTVREAASPVISWLVAIYIAARLVHSAIHIAGLNPMGRLISLGVQFTCLVVLLVLAVT
ncbi:MAG: MAPEG family protein [Kaiparowitsia implicata GSE-PSE-MK54-09C]|nr:MAPEG family protein [Kaiparowitsia implicata GSE-PSE-MK54-09C]